MTPEEIRELDTRLVQRLVDSGDLTWAQVETARALDPNRFNSIEVGVSGVPQPALPLPVLPRIPKKGIVRGVLCPGRLQLAVVPRTYRAIPLPTNPI